MEGVIPAVTTSRTPQSESAVPAVLEVRFARPDLPRLRADIARAARAAGLDQERVGDLVLAAHELAVNSVTHGGGHGTLRLWTGGGDLVCEVVDHGVLGDAAAEIGPPALTGAGGAGLWIARQASDAFTIGRAPHGGTVARMRFALVGPEDRCESQARGVR
jgi:anti-sigma regulatory factor (Ser/Thr protein kinase)